MRQSLCVGLAVLLLGACSAAASPLPPSASMPSEASSPGTAAPSTSSSPSGSASISAELDVTCGPGAPILDPSTVRVSADGVHIAVAGPVGWMLNMTSDGGSEGIQLELARMVFVTTRVVPGSSEVSCADPLNTAKPPATGLRIVDPEGLYRATAIGPTRGSCVSGGAMSGGNPRGKLGDPIAITKAVVSGIKAGDVVERGGCPVEEGSVRIVRAGVVIGHLAFSPDAAGGWLLETWGLCGGLGVSSA